MVLHYGVLNVHLTSFLIVSFDKINQYTKNTANNQQPACQCSLSQFDTLFWYATLIGPIYMLVWYTRLLH